MLRQEQVKTPRQEQEQEQEQEHEHGIIKSASSCSRLTPTRYPSTMKDKNKRLDYSSISNHSLKTSIKTKTTPLVLSPPKLSSSSVADSVDW